MPYYKTDIEREISTAELKAMLDGELDLKYWSVFYLLGTIGARPGEVLGLRAKDVEIGPPGRAVSLTLYTEKLHKRDKGLRYAGACRRAEIMRRFDPPDLALEKCLKYIADRQLIGPETLIFPFSLSALEHRLTALSLRVCKVAYTPYHFRHTRFSDMVSKEGRSLEEVAHAKGGGIESAIKYLKKRPTLFNTPEL